MKIFYYHPLRLTEKSSETLQILRDYSYLAEHPVEVFAYGFQSNGFEYESVLGDDCFGRISLKQYVFSNPIIRAWAKYLFILKILRTSELTFLVTRSHRKFFEAKFFLRFKKNIVYIHECHETTVPHLTTKKNRADKFKIIFQNLLNKVDVLLLTNQSQDEILKKHFSITCPQMILPNGVNYDYFSQAVPGSRDDIQRICTYTGSFNKWKNVGLLYAAMAHLPKNYILRVAGGDEQQIAKEKQKAILLGVEQRVIFLGFLQPATLLEKAINGSHVLVLPLGDNLESQYLTSPMKLVEYMATGIPVASIDYPSVRSIAAEALSLSSDNQPESFAQAIMRADQDGCDKSGVRRQMAHELSYKARSDRYFNYLSAYIAE